jgi:hypothetical protein
LTAAPAIDTVAAWRDIARRRDRAGLDRLLADDVIFHSPVVFTPQRGKGVTTAYLGAALAVLGTGNFRYVREISGERDAVLEFEAELDGVYVNGVDLIRWGDDGRITEFKVMVRPLKAIDALRQKMAEALGRSSSSRDSR